MKNSAALKKTAKNKNTREFCERVFKIVSEILPGDTLTYKEVAMRAGSPKAYRAVGNILNTNYNQAIPCHRVTKKRR